MVQPARGQSLTAEQYFELPDRDLTELLDGRLVPMPPKGALHRKVEGQLAQLLGSFLKQSSAGAVLTGEVGVVTWRNPDRVRGVDLAVISRAQAAEIPDGFLTFPPELVAEVVSRKTSRRDFKRRIGRLVHASSFLLCVLRVSAVTPAP